MPQGPNRKTTRRKFIKTSAKVAAAGSLFGFALGSASRLFRRSRKPVKFPAMTVVVERGVQPKAIENFQFALASSMIIDRKLESWFLSKKIDFKIVEDIEKTFSGTGLSEEWLRNLRKFKASTMIKKSGDIEIILDMSALENTARTVNTLSFQLYAANIIDELKRKGRAVDLFGRVRGEAERKRKKLFRQYEIDVRKKFGEKPSSELYKELMTDLLQELGKNSSQGKRI